ncbi:2463_t:CDS:2 [Ambispora gerdemannii]|uniref:Cytidine deaminase n=1 Tax=Ambispora gerdemannii TaxID=144530 RepID=A0A9N8YWN5_9GLOM|nr:2463_t:CDS:2 [Ambispora gerdemannii]
MIDDYTTPLPGSSSSKPTTRELTDEEIKDLINISINAKEHSYCPYSNFRVGCALLTENGTWYLGATICAERTAIIKAVSEGQREFIAIGVSTDQHEFIAPCGMCRQFLAEFVHNSFPIYLVKPDRTHKKVVFEHLLPNAFRPESLLPKTDEND